MNAQNFTVKMGGGIVFIIIACSNTLASGSIYANSIAVAKDVQVTMLPPTDNQHRQLKLLQLSANYPNYPANKDFSTEPTELGQWQGTYTFSEVVPPNSGTFMFMEYTVAIFKRDSHYSADINIQGQNTFRRLSGDVRQTGKNKVGLYFNSYREGNQLAVSDKKGDLLLQLERLPSNRIKVIWGSISPLLLENRGEFVPEDMAFTKLTEDIVSELIWQLPEVQQKAKEIAQRSHNVVSVGLMLSELPTVDQPYYTVQVYESHPDHIVTIWNFRVDAKNSAISVEDVTTGDDIPLANWRKLQRN